MNLNTDNQPAGITGYRVREAMAQAALVQDLRGRQLSVLRNTYPGWDIDAPNDSSGAQSWTARLRIPLTFELMTAGAQQSVAQVDAIALASALAWQTALINNGRLYHRSRAGQ
ncbi:hypothetical protein SAMN05421874_1284 [Nonomuraea maritima]|uniref:Uncharacterized protein n=1 Tax=Nonomuraea maritima TaxID=683260 RepID=A0A1G9ME75_9ACTN|nr:hypothetical protein [Nonomuraea maritima]SDL72556.1 hypothetical protein SAMN05421874_1284 [Nonomuraea maritima]